MTTIIAYRDDHFSIIAADTQRNFPSRKDKQKDKIWSIKNGLDEYTLFGFSGQGAALIPLQQLSSVELNNFPKFDDIHRLADFASSVHNKLKDLWHMVPEEEEGFELSPYELIIVNKYILARITCMREVIEYDHFAAIGSGSSYVTGFIDARVHHPRRSDTIVDTMKQAIISASTYDPYTGSETQIITHEHGN